MEGAESDQLEKYLREGFDEAIRVVNEEWRSGKEVGDEVQ
jgi:hypothetical protein